MTRQYLKPAIALEPLVYRWYAWPFLIPAQTRALVLMRQYCELLQSFVDAPELHAEALTMPENRGGPFVDLSPERVAEAEALLQDIERRAGAERALSEAIASLTAALQESGGGSLEPLYARVPEALRGLVELVYDRGNRPSFRVLEALLGAREELRDGGQGLLLHELKGDERPFVLSTPRLDAAASLYVDRPFASASVARLTRARDEGLLPAELAALARDLGVDAERLGRFFHAEAPPAPQAYAGDGVRLRYMGHACVLIESAKTSVLVDPLISYALKDPAVARFSFADLPPTIDYALITHTHQDHCVLETILQLRHRVRTWVVPRNNPCELADPSLRRILAAVGVERVVELDELDAIPVADGTITALPFLGEHGDLAVTSKVGYSVCLGGRAVQLVADSNNLDAALFDRVAAELRRRGEPSPAALFLGMECAGAPMSWLYGPFLEKPLPRALDHGRRLNGSDAARGLRLVESFRPEAVYVYAMGAEPWLSYLTSTSYTETSPPIVESDRLVATCRGAGIDAARLFGRWERTL